MTYPIQYARACMAAVPRMEIQGTGTLVRASSTDVAAAMLS